MKKHWMLILLLVLPLQSAASTSVEELVEEFFPDVLIESQLRRDPNIEPYKITEFITVDVNGDGVDEIVAGYGNGSAVILRVLDRTGTLLFESRELGSLDVGLDSFGLNDDEVPEIRLVTNGMHGPTNDWIFTWKDGGLEVINPIEESLHPKFPPASKLFSTSVMDINGDGKLELLSESGDPAIHRTEVYEMEGDSLTRTGTITAYELFVRRAGRPESESRSFNVDDDTIDYEVRLLNGEADRDTQVTAATVVLNGRRLFTPNDFKKNARLLKRSATLDKENTLEVTLQGKPRSFIRVYAMPLEP